MPEWMTIFDNLIYRLIITDTFILVMNGAPLVSIRYLHFKNNFSLSYSANKWSGYKKVIEGE